jgi:hypothetical protein
VPPRIRGDGLHHHHHALGCGRDRHIIENPLTPEFFNHPILLTLILLAALGGIIANRPDTGLPEEYEHKLKEAMESHHLRPDDAVIFVEVRSGDVSEFSGVLQVSGATVERHRVRRCVSPAIPNAIAALLLYVRDQTGKIPHAYFGWTEGNPIVYLMKFLAFGEGDTAPVTREVLRQSEADPLRRPRIHVG